MSTKYKDKRQTGNVSLLKENNKNHTNYIYVCTHAYIAALNCIRVWEFETERSKRTFLTTTTRHKKYFTLFYYYYYFIPATSSTYFIAYFIFPFQVIFKRIFWYKGALQDKKVPYLLLKTKLRICLYWMYDYY